MSEDKILELEIPEELAGKRLDQAIATMLPMYSRARIQQWIRDADIKVDGKVLKPREKVHGGENVVVNVVIPEEVHDEPENIQLDIIHEDDAIIVINKPVGLVVHPAVGNAAGTLLNALLFHHPAIQEVPRAGIVHRLDKDTSGLMVIAKTIEAQNCLIKQLEKHDVEREYDAIVCGPLISGGTVDEPIGRHPTDRKKMAININKGKHAVTHYRLAERFRQHTHLKCRLETGRTHQIRVHMKHIRHPIVGDMVYGNRLSLPPKASDEFKEVLRKFRRQALHASRLMLSHPTTGKDIEWKVDLPDDMKKLLVLMRKDAKKYPDYV